MPSIVSGFEYDIFISYRQNDNRSGWVTEFVNHLNEELAATIKEPVSVYFDNNPHDGLLETHNVDKTLEKKLKSLIFIPILSQTYCDKKSFAWQHELCAFNLAAQDDEFGMDIFLQNGNVASRILPIKIHDLDRADIRMTEFELGTTLRSIDFIFKSAGVNRPLQAHEDHPHDNQNKTYYRDQINKVALAVKELIQGIKNPVPVDEEERVDQITIERSNLRKKIVGTTFLFISIFFGYYAYQKVRDFKSYSAAETQINNSIAVLPFVNMSEDVGQDYFSDGITEQIISNLAHINSLKVIARTSVMKFKKTEKSIAEIGRELNVTHVLEGSIRKSGDHIRVTAQLIAAKDETHVWAQDYDRPLSDIFTVQDEVSQAIAHSLERRLTPGEFEKMKSVRPASVEAYQHYLKGYYFHFDVYYYKHLEEDFIKSENEFKEAIRLDPTYGLAFAGLADLYDKYRNFGARDSHEYMKFTVLRDSCSRIAIKLSPNDPYVISVRAYSFFNKDDRTDADLDSAFKYRRRAFELAPNSASICEALSLDYSDIGLYHQAVRLRERTISLDPSYAHSYPRLGWLYVQLGEWEKAEASLRKGLLMEPDDIQGLIHWVNLKVLTGKLKDAEEAIQKIKSINPDTDLRLFEGYLFALKGEKEKALALSDAWFIYIALGMKSEALDKLEKNTFMSFQYLSLKTLPLNDPLRAEPRFKKILEETKVRYEKNLKRYAN